MLFLFCYFTYKKTFAVHKALASHLITLEVNFNESIKLSKKLLLLVAKSVFPDFCLIKFGFIYILPSTCIVVFN